jgi:hypothetical protein
METQLERDDQRSLDELVTYMKLQIQSTIDNYPDDFKDLIEKYRLKGITTYPYLQQPLSSGLVHEAFALVHKKRGEAMRQTRTTGGYKKRNKSTRRKRNTRKTHRKRK